MYDNVYFEEGVFCGFSMVFMNVYNLCFFIECKNEYCDILIKKGVILGVNCIIVCGVIVGEFVFVGVGVVINKDVLVYVLMVGVFVR